MKRRLKKPSDLSESLHQRLNSYALAASAAGVGLLALVQPAEGEIVYTKVHVALGPDSKHRYDLHLMHPGAIDFEFVAEGQRSGGSLRVYALRKNGMIGPFLSGSTIGPGWEFKTTQYIFGWNFTSNFVCYGPWCNLHAYLGFRFLIRGKPHYGWARLNVGCANRQCAGVSTGYAYETIPDKPIIAGQTTGPDVITVQPASLGHLSRGASAIPAWRGKDQ